MIKLHVLDQVSWAFILCLGLAVTAGLDKTNGCGPPSSLKGIMAQERNDSASVAHLYIEHSNSQNLVIDLGVGNPDSPNWVVNIWNKQQVEQNNISLSIDISVASSFLPPSDSNRWFLKVSDIADENEGQIVEFVISHNNVTFRSACVPVAIFDLQTSYSYIPGVPLELAISRRISIREFPDTENYTMPEVSWELLSKVLWAGYGFSSSGRTVPDICGNYPLSIYVCNSTAAYKYDPQRQSLGEWKKGDYRFSPQGWDRHKAPIELFFVVDKNKPSNGSFGAMEAGCAIQNMYLEANSLGLGTVCVGGVDKEAVQDSLGLPPNEYVISNMPLGHPEPNAFYNFSSIDLPHPPGSPELPPVRQGSVFLDDALEKRTNAHNWKAYALSKQELSQILWSAYGLSFLKDMRPSVWSYQSQHRVVPSADGSYSFTIWIADSTGLRTYDPYAHRTTMEVLGDKRAEISEAVGRRWVASAPTTLVIVWNSGQLAEEEWAYIEAGCVIQNVNLESMACGLAADVANIVSEDNVKSVLGLAQETSLHPIAIISVGSSYLPADLNKDGRINILDLFTVARAFGSSLGSPKWNEIADLNEDSIVNILDMYAVARDFGKMKL
jgi:nitroreductase